MKVFFRVDSSGRIGSGHLTRCLALARQLHMWGSDIHFICRNLEGNLIELVREEGFNISVLKTHEILRNIDPAGYASWLEVSQEYDALQCIAEIGRARPDWLIIDHYAIDQTWEKYLAPYCKFLMVIDDLANRSHQCNLLLDQNYFGNELRYEHLVPRNCLQLLGPKYALLRKDFEILRIEKVTQQIELKRILIFFTSGNDQGETIKAMRGVEVFGTTHDIKVDIVVGDSNQYKLEIEEICTKKGWTFHCQIKYMPSLIASADIIIGGGGSSNWERCALGKPSLISILAQNQADIAKELEAKGAVINLGWSNLLESQDYASALHAIDASKLQSLSASASRIVDGHGTSRVAKVLLENGAKELKYRH